MQLIELTGQDGAFATLDIRGLTSDSRDVQPGWLFAALPGSKADGGQFIADAVSRGAVAVLGAAGSLPPGLSDKVAFVGDENPRRRFAQIAAKFYKDQPRVLVAVTGTNGKTSTVQFARQIWQQLGHKSASLGTLGVTAPGFEKSGALTTPDPVTLHAEIAALAQGGVTHLAMEASSHGLAQYRLDGLRVSAAGFTNLTRDHLDYHGTMEDYLSAKSRLFSDVLVSGGVAVLNADVEESSLLEKLCAKRGIRALTYGTKGKDLKLASRRPTPGGQDIELQLGGKIFKISLPLVGAFQAFNVLCAAGLVLAEDPDNAAFHGKLADAVGRLGGVRGRLELVATHPNGAAVYVDYAHTPDALENILNALRPHTRGKLHVVFGCGGDRDRGKRPQMGKIAVTLADKAVVTDDNPRSEEPAAIRREILAGAPQAIEIGDRAEAIHKAVAALGEGDILVIAGKGHEQGQIIKDTVKPFDDASVARQAVREVAA